MINRYRQEISLPSIIIFCEGETEIAYFQHVKRAYKHHTFVIIKKLTEKSFTKVAQEIQTYLERSDESFSKIYCVFEYNHLSYDDYLKGIKLMKENDIELIFSNQSFEVRFLMHFSKFTR